MLINSISTGFSLASAISGINRSSSRPSVTDVVELALSAQATRKANASLPLQQTDALRSLYDQLAVVKQSAGNLSTTGLSSNVFRQSTVSSSNATAVSATISPGASTRGGATEATYAITVSALAAQQANQGTDVTSTATTTVTSGINAITFDLGGVLTDVQTTVGVTDTNATVLANLADAINLKGLGVSANVVTNATLGTSRLELLSDASGTANGFTVVDKTGDLVANLGFNTIGTAAANAAFTVDGVARSASVNSFALDEARVFVSLGAVSTAAVSLTVGPDTTAIQDSITSFVQDFNDLRSQFSTNGGFFRSGQGSALDSFVNAQQFALADIGITQGTDGSLSIDTTLLETAIADNLGKVSATIGGYNGLATRVGLFSSTIQSTASNQILQDLQSSQSFPTALDLIKNEFLSGAIVDLFV